MTGFAFHFGSLARKAVAGAVSAPEATGQKAVAPPPPGSSTEAFREWARRADEEIANAEFMIMSLENELAVAVDDRDRAQREIDRIAAELQEWREFADQWRAFAAEQLA